MRQASFALLVLLGIPALAARAGAEDESVDDEIRRLEAAYDRAFPTKNPFLAPGGGWQLDSGAEAGVSARLLDEPDCVGVELRVPGSAGREVEASVAGEAVRLVIRGPKTVKQLLPVPEGADPRTLRVEREGDRVRLVFQRNMTTSVRLPIDKY